MAHEMYLLVRYNYSRNLAVIVHAYHNDLSVVEAIYDTLKAGIDDALSDAGIDAVPDLLEIVCLTTPFASLTGAPLFWSNSAPSVEMRVVRSNNR